MLGKRSGLPSEGATSLGGLVPKIWQICDTLSQSGKVSVLEKNNEKCQLIRSEENKLLSITLTEKLFFKISDSILKIEHKRIKYMTNLKQAHGCLVGAAAIGLERENWPVIEEINQRSAAKKVRVVPPSWSWACSCSWCVTFSHRQEPYVW